MFVKLLYETGKMFYNFYTSTVELSRAIKNFKLNLYISLLYFIFKLIGSTANTCKDTLRFILFHRNMF
jgi:hypothetical protein